MIKLLTSPWSTALVGIVLYLGTTVAVWKTPIRSSTVPKESAAAGEKKAGPSWDFTSPEADQLIAELKNEKKALVKKEQDLNDLMARLQAERSELNLVTQSVRQLQTDFDQNVLRITEEETANLKKLAKIYADMAPENAAKVLEEMDDTSIIKIMVFMKDTETAAIWEALAKKGDAQAKRAALLSDHLRLASFRNNAK
ncbi:MAG: MotE family protein [Limisphaerales bacterium]